MNRRGFMKALASAAGVMGLGRLAGGAMASEPEIVPLSSWPPREGDMSHFSDEKITLSGIEWTGFRDAWK